MTQTTPKSGILSDELKLRIISALVLGVLVLVMTWIGGQTFKLLMAIASIAILSEYSRITATVLPTAVKLCAYAFLLLTITAWIMQAYDIAVIIAFGAIVVLMIWELVARRSVWGGIGLAYAVLPFFAMTAIRGESVEGLILVFVLFACVWGADVFAYFFGKSIGGPKLAPRISPKKTWSGFIGSLIGGILISWGVVASAGYTAGVAFFGIIIVLAVTSQIGDLVESVLKRKFGIKDSGTIIPGHGGVLDRIDGLIFSSVILWACLFLLNGSDFTGTNMGSIFFAAFLQP